MKNIEFKPKQVRFFLVLLWIFLILLIFKSIPRENNSGRWVAVAADSGVIGIFLFFPKPFFPVFRLIMIGSGYLGNFIFTLISILVFYLILTPFSLVMRLFGKHFLITRIEPDQASYYEEPEKTAGYENQY